MASTFFPGSTSHLTFDVVNSNCLVPSARTAGARSCAPTPSVLAGNFLVTAAITSSISDGDILDMSGAEAQDDEDDVDTFVAPASPLPDSSTARMPKPTAMTLPTRASAATTKRR